MIATRSYAFPHAAHLSPSQITEYLSCPACFKLARLDRIPRPVNVALPIGSAVHKAVEMLRSSVIEHGPFEGGAEADQTIGELAETFAADHFEVAVQDSADRCDECRNLPPADKAKCSYCGGTGKLAETILDLGDYADAGTAKDHAVKMAKFIAPAIVKLDAQRGLVAAEQDLADFENPWPFPMRGRIDALYSTNGEVYTAGADLKTSSKQQAPDFMAAVQLGIYHSFIPGQWFADVVAKTKTPSFQSYVLEQPSEGFLGDLVLDVADRICRGDFPPRPGFRCNYVHGQPKFTVAVSWPEV